MSFLSAPYFHDEAAAFAELERILWPDGPVCPRCNGKERITSVKGGRKGLRRCGPCKRQFTVKVGTLLESSHVPLNLWVQAIYLMCCSKKGISSHQLMRVLGVQYKTAWFMTHRIREAMKGGALPPIGGNGAVVEIDETFIGRKPGHKPKRGYSHKNAVLTLVQRGGSARSFHVEGTKAADLLPIIQANVHPSTEVMTDEAGQYKGHGKHFASHGYVSHSQFEWGRGKVHTNTVEGFYSVFKRGMKGVYQHCAEKHLHRYVAEFDFRYNQRAKFGITEQDRTQTALRGMAGKRLTYKSVDRSKS
ncbi:IS1595 family transposase [Cyanobium gracile]|uniref:Transposase n=1 Tax=Cyanobium gracile (strain ATCC 27147 / PCC 6307) TaxID=292564 RepID=K9PAQ7_CYAGP|nr:IS1595 family transposase [Cyanobium gracile]AFY30437.1 transposase [Cyanobium gracile PCC 6307]